MLGADRPAGLMQGYQGDDGKLSGADGDLYRSGDVVFADDEGYLTFVGRSDDVFKSSRLPDQPVRARKHPAGA